MFFLHLFIVYCIISAHIRENSSKTIEYDVKMTQTLLNDGFHRNLTFGIVFLGNQESKWLHTHCKIGIDQELPAGVFCNPDELEDLRRSEKINAKPKSRVNIELPTEESSPISVFIIANVVDGRTSAWIPVHARYHQAVPGGGTARNVILSPRLFLNCPDNRLDLLGEGESKRNYVCNGSKESCRWMEISYNMVSERVVWDVPVGNTKHYHLVAIATLIVIVLGSLYLFKTLHEFKVNEEKKL